MPSTDRRPRILLLGDSFTEGKNAWPDTYVAKIAAHFPQYDFLNGGVSSYSPSNYFNVARLLLTNGIQFDDAIVFIDLSDAQDEAAFYRDIDPYGAVTGPAKEYTDIPWYGRLRLSITKHLYLTNSILEFADYELVEHGLYRMAVNGSIFDAERAAWTYRKVNEIAPYSAGYAPLGLEEGISKEKIKMDRLWRELHKRGIPITVVVYPYPAQLVHDSTDSRQVRIWREWCEGKCTHFISLFPVFFEVKNQCGSLRPFCWYSGLFTFGDAHFNAAGNALVAEAVIASLEKDPPAKRLQVQ